MKWQKTFSAAAIAALALGAGACDDGLAEINENPNAPTDVPAQYLLPVAMQGTVETFFGAGFNLEFAGLFTQHWAKIQYIEEDLYELRPSSIDAWWSGLYAGPLKDWQTIIQKGEATGVVNHEATGRVMKAYTGHIMTDVWGDIPWSQALQGDAEEPITTPVYDAQSAIYADLIAELDAALALFDPSERTWGPEDILYQGDIAGWMKFANSLKLRLAVRMSDVDPTGAAALVAEVLAHPAGLITTNADNAALVFLEAAPNQNPLYENWVGGRDDHAVSSTLVNMLDALNDPRLAVYAEPAASDGAFRGMTNGTFESDIPPINTLSRIGEHWRSHTNTAAATTPAFLLTAAEVHLLLAEAVQQGLVASALGMGAQALYEQGVTLSLQMWDGADGVDIDAGDIADYLAEPGVEWGTPPAGDAAPNNYELIIEQKWIALYTNGAEAWAELRRTGYPDEVVARAAHEFPFIPGRIPYSDIEQSLNAENLAAAMAAQGITGLEGYEGTVWWDTTPQD